MTPAAYRRLQANVADPAKAHKRRAPVLSEGSVKRAIEDYLTVELGPEGLGWFRMNSGEAERDGRRVKLAPAGTADLLAIVSWYRESCFPCPEGYTFPRCYDSATPLWIEVKAPEGKTDKLRAAQQAAFRREMEARGCIAIQAASLDDVKAVLPPRGER